MQILGEKSVFLHFKIFFTNNGFERRSLIFRWLKLEKLLALERVSFLWENLKINLYEMSGKRRLVLIMQLLLILSIFCLFYLNLKQVKEVCLHAGHASVHMNSLWITYTRFEGHGCQSFWNSKVFLNHVLINPPSLWVLD